jgi:valyl-tRNA synthetase
MSKSIGNVVNPDDIINEFGAEAFRAWAFSDSNITDDDVRFSKDRVRGASKMLTKIWNVSRFISTFVQPEERPDLYGSDKWILSALSETAKAVMELNESYRFERSAFLLREFTWNVFADHYIEMVKNRAYGSGFSAQETAAARYTLHRVLKSIVMLWAPMLPMLSDSIYTALYSGSTVHKELYPDLSVDQYGLSAHTGEITAFNSMVWNRKKELGKSWKDPIEMAIPEGLRQFEKDIKSLHNIM